MNESDPHPPRVTLGVPLQTVSSRKITVSKGLKKEYRVISGVVDESV